MTAEERAETKLAKMNAQEIKDQMTVDQLINFVNTPYCDLPENLKVGMTRRPQKFNFIKMIHPNIGDQRETFAARLIRYRTTYHLSVDEFASIANEFAVTFGARVTKRDILNYENYNICPKIDKMMAISQAMGVSVDYFAGYGTENRKSRNDIIESRKMSDAPISITYEKEMARRVGTDAVFQTCPASNKSEKPSA
jgi:transcriptional regulator with XRE-family HTH domain